MLSFAVPCFKFSSVISDTQILLFLHLPITTFITTQVRVSDIGKVMRLLGADWDEVELEDAIAALDQSENGHVEYDNFIHWWRN
jgi:hypothetical protein